MISIIRIFLIPHEVKETAYIYINVTITFWQFKQSDSDCVLLGSNWLDNCTLSKKENSTTSFTSEKENKNAPEYVTSELLDLKVHLSSSNYQKYFSRRKALKLLELE